MSEYKMNQYDLQSYFKSLCNSFYIAYSQVKRLEKERERLQNDYHEEDLKTVKGLLGIASWVIVPNKYVTLKYSSEELLQEKERLEAKKEENERDIKELSKILEFWSSCMYRDLEAIKGVINTIKNNNFSIIVTTKEEIYALISFYAENRIKKYPIVNVEEEYKQVFPTGEKMYDEFFYLYKKYLDESETKDYMTTLYYKYF